MAWCPYSRGRITILLFGEFGITYEENSKASWPFEEIPGRHEIYGSLFRCDTDDDNRHRVSQLIGRLKDIIEQGPSMAENIDTLVAFEIR